MRITILILIAAVTSACASRPIENDAYARAQAACGDYEVVDDGPIGSRTHQTRQDERQHCIRREAARNDSDSIAFREAFDDALKPR
jgi:hypothetical protein